MHNELRDFLNKQSLVDQNAKAFTYGDGPAGSLPLRTALSSFFNSYFNPVAPVQPAQLMATNGCSAAIEHCAWALANPGEGILLGRPYYRAFVPDMGLRAGVKVVGVAFGDVDPCGPECVSKYEEALEEAEREGVKVRALMLCHPHNPLGRCYSKETIEALMRLCQKHSIHLVSDEIYALSVFDNNVDNTAAPPTPFQSALSIDTAGIIDPARVHVLWGFSKDFGANGIRLGVILSQSNSAFLAAARTCSLYSSPSSLAENAAIALLSDKAFLASYIRTNQERISTAYAHAVSTLRKHGIEHMPGVNATFFLWINLGKKFLERPTNGVDAHSAVGVTQMLFERLMDKKVFLVLGDAAGAEQQGWFRLVFTQAPELVDEGLRRIAEALQA